MFARKTIPQVPGSITKMDIDNEAKAIDYLRSQSQHRNIIQVFRHGWLISPGQTASLPIYRFDMELGDLTLHQFIQDKFGEDPFPGITPWELWTILLDIEGGLMFIHQRQMIHRDLKPANSKLFLLVVLN